MARVISVHSFRGGTGKSNITASLAALMASQGQRVGAIDADIQSPGIHVLFGMDDALMPHSLNHYLWGKCDIQQAAYDVTDNLGAQIAGRIFLIPSSTKAGEITRILREGYDVGLLNDGLKRLVDDLDLDVLMIDTHPGLNEETLLSMAICDTLAIVLRPDQQDYQGTSVTVEVARRLGAPRMLLIVNKVPPVFDPDSVKTRVEQTYGCDVAAVLPHSDELMVLASAGVFALRYPDHPVTTTLKAAGVRLLGD
jgi:MinD-like ATPase involved in chromosome partitioning or flagellar assembly